MKIILIIFLVINLYAKDELYFLPKDSKEVVKKIEKLIKTSQKSIDIAMYNFGYKKFAKLLKKAQKRGVEVKIIYDKKSVNFDGIKTKTMDRKLHTKIAIFDKKTVIFGSSNWTKKSFNKNYEVLYFTDDKSMLKEFNDFFKQLSE